jgi:hypothetical protein
MYRVCFFQTKVKGYFREYKIVITNIKKSEKSECLPVGAGSPTGYPPVGTRSGVRPSQVLRPSLAAPFVASGAKNVPLFSAQYVHTWKCMTFYLQ